MMLNTKTHPASSKQIALALGERLGKIRLGLNQTQEHTAREAGISRATLVRLEQGRGVSLDTFIRVMMALRLHEHLEQLLPDPAIRPLDRVAMGGQERQRARPKQNEAVEETWTWGTDE